MYGKKQCSREQMIETAMPVCTRGSVNLAIMRGCMSWRPSIRTSNGTPPTNRADASRSIGTKVARPVALLDRAVQVCPTPITGTATVLSTAMQTPLLCKCVDFLHTRTTDSGPRETLRLLGSRVFQVVKITSRVCS